MERQDGFLATMSGNTKLVSQNNEDLSGIY